MYLYEVILIGLGVVFLTLGILTIATEIQQRIINRYFLEEEVDTAEEELEREKVAAIVAAIHSGGER